MQYIQQPQAIEAKSFDIISEIIAETRPDYRFASPLHEAIIKRVIHTTERPAFLAKNRYGLPDTLPLDWQAFAQAMPEAIQPLLMTAPVAPHATNA